MADQPISWPSYTDLEWRGFIQFRLMTHAQTPADFHQPQGQQCHCDGCGWYGVHGEPIPAPVSKGSNSQQRQCHDEFWEHQHQQNKSRYCDEAGGCGAADALHHHPPHLRFLFPRAGFHHGFHDIFVGDRWRALNFFFLGLFETGQITKGILPNGLDGLAAQAHGDKRNCSCAT